METRLSLLILSRLSAVPAGIRIGEVQKAMRISGSFLPSERNDLLCDADEGLGYTKG